ncbi:MAG: hypothetical protein WC179_07770 [Candidatus Cloacimonadaceae bacterium]
MEETKIPTPRELLKEKADLLGIAYKTNTPDAKLIEMIEAKMKPAKEEITVKPKKEKTEEEIISEATAAQRKSLMKLRRVIVSCMDPGMKDWDTTPFLSISNSILTLPKITVPLNVEWHIPQAYYDLLKSQKCFISVKGKDSKGRPITVRKEINKYSIQNLPDLTIKEIQELKQAQIMRDGIQTM